MFTMNEISNYKSLEFKLYDCLAQLRAMCVSGDLSGDGIRELDDTLERIKTRYFSIAVMGEFKRGKSTFINALLGMRILPADVTPTTATVNRIIYGDEPGAIIKYKDGHDEQVALSELSDYVTKLTQEAEQRAVEIESAVISYPTAICANHIEIIDTPGLNDDAAMTELSTKTAERVDAVILVLSALSPFSELETKFAARLISLENIDALFFVVSFIDQIDEDEREQFLAKLKSRIINAIRAELAETPADTGKADHILNNLNFCAVSSTEALDAILRGDNKLLRKSNLETLKTSLFQFLTATQGYSLIQKSKAAAEKYCGILKQTGTEALNKFNADGEWLKTADEKLTQYRENGPERFNALRGRLNELSNEVVLRINREKNACAKRCVEVMNSADCLPPDEQIRFIEFTIAETRVIVNELAPELKNLSENSARLLFKEFGDSTRNIIDEAVLFINKTTGKKLRTLDCFDSGFDVLCAVPVPGFRWPAESGNLIGQARWLSEINAGFKTFVDSWANYISELFGVWRGWVEIERGGIASFLISELVQARVTYTAQKNITVKSLEKDQAKLNEIQEIINAI